MKSYDDEDLRLASSAEFWQMIELRRHSGGSIPLAELKERLNGGLRKRSVKRSRNDQQKGARPKRTES